MFTILFQDEALVAIHKPAGMLVHRSELDANESNVVLQQLSAQLGHHLYPVHRLDKATSGVLMFALSPEAAATIQEGFAQQRIKKTYLALVRGHADEGVIDHALSDKRDHRRSGLPITAKQLVGKSARTNYKSLLHTEIPIPCGRYERSRYSLVALHPHSGRRHQLRRHMKHINHPIIGDTTYGQGVHNRLFREHFNCHRLLLIAMQLRLTHPISGQPLELRTQLDADFEQVLLLLNWSKADIQQGLQSYLSLTNQVLP